MIVEKKVIVELKSVEKVTAVHKKQIQTYLRLIPPQRDWDFSSFSEKP